jgi:hypothetical protein
MAAIRDLMCMFNSLSIATNNGCVRQCNHFNRYFLDKKAQLSGLTDPITR